MSWIIPPSPWLCFIWKSGHMLSRSSSRSRMQIFRKARDLWHTSEDLPPDGHCFLINCFFWFFVCLFICVLATLWGRRALSSPIRHWTHVPGSGSVESQPLDGQGSPIQLLFFFFSFLAALPHVELPWPGIKPSPPSVEAHLTTGPPGKSYAFCFAFSNSFYLLQPNHAIFKATFFNVFHKAITESQMF